MKSKRLKMLKSKEGSFVIDIFLLPFLGMFIVFLAKKLYRFFGRYDYTLSFLLVIGVIIFWGISFGFYLGLFGPPGSISAMSGNDFMWNWPIYPLFGFRVVPLAYIPTYTYNVFLTMLAFMFFTVIYPLLLFGGIQLGKIFFGCSEKQKGAIDLLFPRPRNSKNPFN